MADPLPNGQTTLVSHPAVQPILCAVGNPVAGNPLQFAFECLLAETSLDWRFISLNVQLQSLSEAIAGAAAMGIAGIAISTPFETQAPSLLDSLSESSQRSGWVDCVRRVDQKFHGENLLGQSMVEQCLAKLEATEHVWLIGSSARAKAVAIEFMLRGIATWLVDPSLPKIEGFQVASEMQLEAEKATAIIDVESTTPRLSDLHFEMDSSKHMLASTALEPWSNNSIQLAVTGVDVLTESIARYFEIWTDHAANRSIIREACEEYFEL